jgi:hypothetical protein
MNITCRLLGHRLMRPRSETGDLVAECSRCARLIRTGGAFDLAQEGRRRERVREIVTTIPGVEWGSVARVDLTGIERATEAGKGVDE